MPCLSLNTRQTVESFCNAAGWALPRQSSSAASPLSRPTQQNPSRRSAFSQRRCGANFSANRRLPRSPGATWYEARAVGDGLQYTFEPGALAATRWLSADLLLDGIHLAVFRLQLQEGEKGPAFVLSYGLLNQCSARLRLALESVNQNRWMYPREGAWIKPLVSGQRVDLAKVDRMTITIAKKSGEPVRWCQTAVAATAEEPPLLERLVLPKGPLMDEMGQSTLHDWPGKSRNTEEVSANPQTV